MKNIEYTKLLEKNLIMSFKLNELIKQLIKNEEIYK